MFKRHVKKSKVNFTRMSVIYPKDIVGIVMPDYTVECLIMGSEKPIVKETEEPSVRPRPLKITAPVTIPEQIPESVPVKIPEKEPVPVGEDEKSCL